MAMLNPKDFDSKGGPSGTVEVVAAGDLSGHDLSVKFPKALLGGGGVGSYLPLIGHERGRSHLKDANFLPLTGQGGLWRRSLTAELHPTPFRV